MSLLSDPAAVRIMDFLGEIGLTARVAPIETPTFLPGIETAGGVIWVDPARLLYPGDLLHEAGHMAVLTPAERPRFPAEGDDLGMEIGAIAWSWAALRHLDFDPAVVFHPAGYRGASGSFIENFMAGRYVGVPLLQWMGLTTTEAYPAMSRWLRE